MKLETNQQVYRVLVWSGWLRVAHWLMAGGTIGLIVTGWLLRYPEITDPRVSDYHYLFGHALLASLLIRGYLLLTGKRTDGWRTFTNYRGSRPPMRDMLMFYLSLGRMPLPAYYAHSPVWRPIYILMFALLAIQALTGYGYDVPYRMGTLTTFILHDNLAPLIEMLVLLHVFSVVLQDGKGSGSDVSAMINGHRTFSPQAPESVQKTSSQTGDSVSVQFDLEKKK